MSDALRWVTMKDAERGTDIPASTIRRRVEQGTFEVDDGVTPKLYGIPEDLFTNPATTTATTTDPATAIATTTDPATDPATAMATTTTDPAAATATTDADLVASLKDDKLHLRDELAALHGEMERREAGSAQREVLSKARVVDLERAATVREGRIADMEAAHADVLATHAAEVTNLRGQVAVLEAKVRETLEAHTEKLGDLASDIAELANSKAQMELRVYELEPVASQVPMLQAAVEEKDAALSDREHELSNVRDDIEAIANRPVAGPVFRLLTKGKLRV
jgi:hypothetical protein